MRILITGVDGFLGKHIARGLLDDGRDIFGISDGEAPDLNIEFLQTDITDREALAEATKRARADLCIHLAALAHADVGDDRAPLVHKVNVEGSLNLFDALEAAGTRQVIYFSSVKVLADTTPPEGIFEDAAPQPMGIYAESKRTVERALAERTAAGRLEGVVVRPAAVVGPNDVKGNYAKMAQMISRGLFPVVGTGRARRSLVFVDTVVRRIRTMVSAGLIPGRCYVFSDGDWSIREIVDAMRAASGFAFCPTVPIEGTGRVMEAVDAVYSRLRHGRTPVADFFKRLNASFVVHADSWDRDYGALPATNIREAAARTFQPSGRQ